MVLVAALFGFGAASSVLRWCLAWVGSAGACCPPGDGALCRKAGWGPGTTACSIVRSRHAVPSLGPGHRFHGLLRGLYWFPESIAGITRLFDR